MKSPYRPSPSDFQSLIAAINSGRESELESAVTRIAKAAFAAKRKPRTKCAKRREISK
jgi:hypothetical protein